MKKLFSLLAMAFLLTFAVTITAFGQNEAQPAATDSSASTTQTVDTAATTPSTTSMKAPTDEVQQKKAFHYILKEKFIEGGPGFMATILLCLIFGLGLVIEKIIYLTMSTTNSSKLLDQINEKLDKEGPKAAMELCRNTRGPIASIFYQGLNKYDEGVDMVEKSLTSYGSVAIGNLERGLQWISLFIALAPSLGFLGTVIGMVQAFDKIAIVGEMSPAVVAGGMKVALLTTILGLIVAMILQVFYNYILVKIENIVVDMEDSSISFLDIIAAKQSK